MLTNPDITDEEIIKGLGDITSANIPVSIPQMATGTALPVGVLVNEIKQAKEDAQHKEILDAIAKLSNHSAAQADVGKSEKASTKSRKEKLRSQFDALQPNTQKNYRDIGKVYQSMRNERDQEFKTAQSDELPNINAENLRDRLKEAIADKKLKLKIPTRQKIRYYYRHV